MMILLLRMMGELAYLQHLKDTSELHDVEPIESFRVVAKPESKTKAVKL